MDQVVTSYPTLTARSLSATLLELLAAKHSQDLFVPECKDGSTWLRNSHSRLDAWVMLRSWAKWKTIGYEIKIDRNDFLRDEKWPNYLELCHELSFVCPQGLIDPAELPEGVGLLWASKNFKRLFTKRKAARREIETPVNLLLYILMCRAVVVNDMYEANGNLLPRAAQAQRWREWLEGERSTRDLGHMVGQAVAERMVGCSLVRLEQRPTRKGTPF